MDFKKLLSQLDTIEQRQLLKESEELLERAHIKDVEATASITDKAQRYAALAKLAKDGKYVGMFDPVTGNFIDQNGNAAWFGAYKDEVAQLAKHGLIPDSAKEKTSHFLGMMGMDEKEAGAIQTDVRTREQAIQKATGLIDKALESLKAQPSATSNVSNATVDTTKGPANMGAANNESLIRGSLAQALTESFGYNYTSLIESISREDHQYIKKVLTQIDKVEGDDDVTEFKAKYAEYTKRRDQLIEQIKALVQEIQSKPLKESQQIDEGAVDILKSIAGKAALPLYAIYEVYHAWQAIKAIPKGWPKERYKNEVTKIIAKPIAEIGISAFAIAIGTMLAGPIGGLGAGVASMFVSNSTSDAIASTIANLIYSGGKDDGTTNPGTGDKETQNNNSTALHQHLQYNKTVQDLQNKLGGKAKLPKFGPDGKLGSETIGAIQAYRKEKGIKSDAEAIAQLLGISDVNQAVAAVQPTSESIIYSSMTETERMAYLAKRLRGIEQVNEGLKQRIFTAILDRLPFIATERAVVGEIGTTANILSGKYKGTWTWNDSLGKYTGPGGKTLAPKDLAKVGAEAEAIEARATATKSVQHDQVEIGTGSQKQTYTHNGKQWVDATGKPVKNPGVIADLEKANAEIKGAAHDAKVGTSNSAGTPTPAPATSGVAGKAQQAISKIKNSRLGKLANNQLFLTVAAALGTAGFLFSQDGNIIGQGLEDATGETNPDTPNGPVTPNNPTNPTNPGTDDKAKTDPRLDQLKTLIQQYNDAFPDDPLPADLQKQVTALTGTTGTADKETTPTPTKPRTVSAVDIAKGIQNGTIDPEKGIQ